MFNPKQPDDILNIQEQDLLRLPSEEDDWHEYKSSSTTDKELGKKLCNAASGFWNSGGGLFVAGVNDKGEADGGISLNVKRTSRRDWIDQQLAKVTPLGSYVVKKIETGNENSDINSNTGVFLVAFSQSEISPHMSQDHCYYIRNGAHTVRCKHFLVEALFARQGLRTPVIQHILRRKSNNNRVIEMGIINLSPTPALNVSIQIDEIPKSLEALSPILFPLNIPIISEKFPFFFDIALSNFLEDYTKISFQVSLNYRDTAQKSYDKLLNVDLGSQLGPILKTDQGMEKIESELSKISKSLSDVKTPIEKQLKDIAKQIKEKR